MKSESKLKMVFQTTLPVLFLLLWVVSCVPKVPKTAPASVTEDESIISQAEDEEEDEDEGEQWYKDMDYGPYFTGTLEVSDGNFAYKGVAVRLDDGPGGVANGNAFVVFDTDLLRYAAGWTGPGFVDWTNIAFDGSHTTHMSIVGQLVFINPVIPGWGNPQEGSFEDPRLKGLDLKPYGPLPRKWAHWKGLYVYGDRVALSYRVGDADVLEVPGLEQLDGNYVFTRTLDIGRSSHNLDIQVIGSDAAVADLVSMDTFMSVDTLSSINESIGILRGAEDGPITAVACVGGSDGLQWHRTGSNIRLSIPASATPARFKILIHPSDTSDLTGIANLTSSSPMPSDIRPLTVGGPGRWQETITTRGQLGEDDGPFASDVITLPQDNPWYSLMRLGGFDFFEGGQSAAVCTWQGDVWIVDGLGGSLETLTWKRIASGMFQPLGLRIVDGDIYVTCRDQITILRDLNGDGETDFYENFNNDAQVTEHFHEFAMCLQTDSAGNFYYTKGARHAKDAIVPQHGTIIRVSKDGKKSEILANGFRAPNGLVVNSDGSFITSDQQGHWTPANRINWVEPGGFYGNMGSYSPGRRSDDFEPPVCWIHNRIDRSPAEQLWVTSDRWAPLKGSLLSLSYGTGRIFNVLHESVGDVKQGGIVRLPLMEFPTGIMRGRFNSHDGQLYTCGLFGWSSNKTLPGGFYRIRYTGKTLHLPVQLFATAYGVVITFTNPLDPATAGTPHSYSVERWNYRRTPNYGSADYRVSNGRKGHDRLYVSGVTLSEDRRSVFLQIPDMRPAMQMEIKYNLRSADGQWLSQLIHHTVHVLGDPTSLEGIVFDEELQPPPQVSPDQLSARELQQGLALTFTDESQSTAPLDSRRARVLALYVPKGETPSPFMAPGRFHATWEGYLQPEIGGNYTFYAEGRGAVTLWVNGQEVMSTRLEEPTEREESSPVRLQPTPNSIYAEFTPPREVDWRGKKIEAGDAILRIYWSSNKFRQEPIPPEVFLFNPITAGLERFDQLRAGRELFANHRCMKCHLDDPPGQLSITGMPELSFDAPLLSNIGSRVNQDWLGHWIENPHALRPDALMPNVLHGPGIQQQAADIAAFLVSLGEDNAASPENFSGDEVQGEALFQALGCMGCHPSPGTKVTDRFDRISLDYVKSKWKPDALGRFLLQPDHYYKSIRMPNFKLGEKEANDLVAYLMSGMEVSLGPITAGSTADPSRGRELFSASGCLSCHIMEMPNKLKAPNLERLEGIEWARGCLAETESGRGNAPDFDFSDDEKRWLRAFSKLGFANLSRQVSTSFSSRQIDALRCTACHTLDGEEDTWSKVADAEPSAKGVEDLSALLGKEHIADYQGRPPLTWVGEKLKADWMRDFLAGRNDVKPRPGLVAVMPAFPAYADQISNGLAMDHGFSPGSAGPPTPDPEAIEIGESLINVQGGLACMTCHSVGVKRNAGGTRTETINFAVVADRMRKEYFDRFMIDPPRIDPQTGMPRYADDSGNTGITAFYQGDAQKQFEAIWQYIQSVERVVP